MSDDDIDFGAMALPLNEETANRIRLVTSDWVDATAHIEGSYQQGLDAYSYGVVVACEGASIELSGRGSDPRMLKFNRVSGELLAAVTAMSFCIRFGISHLDLIYDFNNLEQWSLGNHKTKVPVTKKYQAYYDSIQDALSVTFNKVTAHSGDTTIHRVEQLASAALTAPDDFSVKINPALVGAGGWGTTSAQDHGIPQLEVPENPKPPFIDEDDSSEMFEAALEEFAQTQGTGEAYPRIRAESDSPEVQVTPSPLSAVFQSDVQRVAILLLRSDPVNVFLVSDSPYMLEKMVDELEISGGLPNSLLHGWTIRNMNAQIYPEHVESVSPERTVGCIQWDIYKSMDRTHTGNLNRWVFTISQGEYMKLNHDSPTLTRLIIPVHLHEPELETLKLIARYEADRLASVHQVTYPQIALDEALRLSVNAQGSAVDHMLGLLDSAGGAQHACGSPTVKAADVTAAHYALEGRTPAPQSINLEERLAEHVKGQKDAVHAVARAVSAARLYQGRTHKPLASLLLTGPSGTGKTLIATRLAVELFGSANRLIRFDMSGYKDDKDAQLRLIGGSPVWKNSDGEGDLTRALRRMPDAVYLFDELEKAHPSVKDLFLRMLDEGHITSGAGVTLNLDQSILVFTTNVGVDTRVHGGLTSDSPSKESYFDPIMLHDEFAPEFLNRFDEIITFEPLSSDALASIAGQGITLTFDEEVPKMLSLSINEPSMGARPLDRAIRRRIAAPLAQLRDANPDLKAVHIKIVLTSGGIELVPVE